MSEPARHPRPVWDETRVEHAIGHLLRVGVLLSALVVLVGGVVYLIHHGGQRPSYRSFHGEPHTLRGLSAVVGDALALNGRGIIQFGLLLLIATPVMRVAFAAYAFVRGGDRLYAGISLLVLAILLFSLLYGH